jgi:hypothetical protein
MGSAQCFDMMRTDKLEQISVRNFAYMLIKTHTPHCARNKSFTIQPVILVKDSSVI